MQLKNNYSELDIISNKLHKKYRKIRFFDITVSILALIILFPIMVLIGIFIKMDSKGPVIFKQKRVGKDLKEFDIYKFRTMVSNAEDIGPKSTMKNDSRITKIGKFLRKTSLDEIPQFLNVLKGEMSLVGPRPGVKEHINFADGEIRKKYEVEPGITGYAQVYGRSKCTPEEKKYYELKYVEEKSIKTNIIILLLTIKVIICNKGSW